jgi:hypothetical protein
MDRRLGVLVVGVALTIVLAAAAYAGNTIGVKDVSVFRGSEMHFTAEVVYRCDARDAKGIDYDVHDTKTDAHGHGLANYPTCDGREHLVRVPGESTDGGLFNRGDPATVHIWMTDSHVNLVPGADTTEAITLH